MELAVELFFKQYYLLYVFFVCIFDNTKIQKMLVCLDFFFIHLSLDSSIVSPFHNSEISIPSGETQILSFGVERGAFTSSQASSKAFNMVLTFNFN